MPNTASITITGNLTRDPVSFGEGEVRVARFRVAVNQRLKANGEWGPHTSYFEVVSFGRLAEQCLESLTKGQKVCVVGSCLIRPPREHEGKTYVDIEVQASGVEFLTPRGDAAEPDPVQADGGGLGAGWEGDIPF